MGFPACRRFRIAVRVMTVLMTIGAAGDVFGQATPASAPSKTPTDDPVRAGTEHPDAQTQPAKSARSSGEAPTGANSDPVADSQPTARGPAIEKLRTAVLRLQRTLAPLTAEKNLIDNLYYPLFDRPRRRATLAVLIKVTQMLSEELAAHRRGRGEIPIARLVDAANWCGTAIDKLDQSESRRVRLPNRTQVTAATLRLDTDGMSENRDGQLACLVGWIDGSRRPFHPDTRDVDILACLGVRIYSLSPNMTVPAWQRRKILLRCQALGIGFLDRLDTASLPQAILPSSDRVGLPGPEEDEVARIGVDLTPPQPRRGGLANALRAVAGWSEAIPRIYAPPLREIMRPKTTSSPLWTASIVPAVRDPDQNIFLSGSLAMREVLMGVCDRQSMIATRWHIPRLTPNEDDIPTSAQWRAGMWLHALTGQRIGLLDGWAESTPGSPAPSKCMFLYPDLIETTAHTALEIQAAGQGISAFPGERDVAFMVGPSAWKPNQNAWAEGFLLLYSQCMEHQLYPRLLPTGVLADPLRYRALRAVVVTNGGDAWKAYRGSLQALRRAGVQIIGWEQVEQQANGIKQASAELADRFFVEADDPGGLINYLTRMWQDGAILRGQARFTIDRTAEAGVVWARSAIGTDGEYYVALVNWSPGRSKVHVKFPIPYEKKSYVDLLSGRTATAATAHDLAPWEVRLLASEQTGPQTMAGK